jgi:sugar-specific transcriptional regulator TrmB
VSKELLEKGVIREDIGASKSYLVALPPEELRNLIQREERELNNKKELIKQAVTELQSLTKNTKYSIPKITFVYEEDLENFLYTQTPEWNRSIKEADNTWWGFQDPSFVKHYQKWIDWYWQKAVPDGVSLKLLSSQAAVEKEMATRGYDRRMLRFWESGKDVTATMWINGEYLVIIMTSQKPCYLVQIHDVMLTHNLREVFKSIWENEK